MNTSLQSGLAISTHYRNGEAVVLDGLPDAFTVTIDRLTYDGYMDVSHHPNFNTNGLVYLAYVNEMGRMAVARFNFKNRSVENLEIIFESNAFSIGSRITWQDDEHFFLTQGMGAIPPRNPVHRICNMTAGRFTG